MKCSGALIISLWNGYFYKQRDPSVCSAIRIGLALVVIVYYATLLPQAEFFFGENGALSVDAARDYVDPDTWTLFSWLPRDTMVATWVVGLVVFQATLLAVGFASRLQAMCLYVLIYSLNYRNPLMLDGEDTVLRTLIFLSVFMPLDARWSLWRYCFSRDTPPTSRALPALGVMRLCVVGVFASTLWLKLDGDAWLDGTALYYVVRLTEFAGRFPYPLFLFEDPFWVRLLTWTVLLIQGIGMILIWSRRCRPYAILTIIGLHLAIDYTMNLYLFQWIMIVGWTAFLDRDVLRVWRGHWHRVSRFVFKKGGALDVRAKS